MKISCIYGKRIESLAGRTGYVISVNYDNGKLTSLTCADEDEKLFYVYFDSIKSIKSKIIYKGGEYCRAFGTPLRLGVPAFDCGGILLGKLTDFTAEKGMLTYAHIGNKKFPASDIAYGDAVIVKNSARILKSDVKANGKTIIRRGTPLTPDVARKAQRHGEYVQTNLKTLL